MLGRSWIAESLSLATVYFRLNTEKVWSPDYTADIGNAFAAHQLDSSLDSIRLDRGFSP